MDLFNKEQKIALYIEGHEKVVEMICTIEEIMDDRLVLNPPQYFMRYIDLLQVGNSFTARAFSKFGTIDFNSIVISSPLEDKFVIELDYNAVRLNEEDNDESISAIEPLDIKYEKGTLHVKTFELSSKYVKFNYDEELEIGKVCDFTVFLPKDYGIINFRGEISERDPIYESEYTATFVTITEKDRQTLVYYMYMYAYDV